MDVLVVDIGGSQVKMLDQRSSRIEDVRFGQGSDAAAARASSARIAPTDWNYDVISLGYPGAVDATRTEGRARQPRRRLGALRLREGLRQTRARAQRRRDAGARRLRRRAHALPRPRHRRRIRARHRARRRSARARLPPLLSERDALRSAWRRRPRSTRREAWLAAVTQVTTMLREAFVADYVLLGGGNATRVHPLPHGTRRGGNEDAFTGGFRLWEEVVEPHDRRSASAWRVVR